MNEAALHKHLEALAGGKEDGNAPLVSAYLKDDQALAVARVLGQATTTYTLNKTPLFLPSSCLPLLD